MDILLVVIGVIIGAFVALMNYGAGKIGATGDTIFNFVKGGLCMIVGAAFGAVVAWQGGTVSPDIIAAMFSTFTISGFGIVWLIDTITQMITGFLQPKSSLMQSLAQGMAVPKR